MRLRSKIENFLTGWFFACVKNNPGWCVLRSTSEQALTKGSIPGHDRKDLLYKNMNGTNRAKYLAKRRREEAVN